MMAEPAAQHGTSVEVPAGGHARVFPPFDKQTFPSQLLWLTLTFVALYLLMSRIALPRIGSILEQRRARMAGDLEEAQRLKGRSDEAIAAYEKALAEARARAQALVNEARQRQAAEAEARRKQHDAKLNAHIAEAEKTISGVKSAAMANVHGIAVDAAGAIVKRLIGIAPANREAIAAAVADVLKR
jgi:F-type H+-transporting ATPase subunit b